MKTYDGKINLIIILLLIAFVITVFYPSHGLIPLIKSDLRAIEARQSYNKIFLYSLQNDPIYKLNNAYVISVQNTVLIYIIKNTQGFSPELEQIYLPVAVITARDNKTKKDMKILKIGGYNYKYNNLTINIRLRTKLNAEQIWYLYYRKIPGSNRGEKVILPSIEFNDLTGYYII